MRRSGGRRREGAPRDHITFRVHEQIRGSSTRLLQPLPRIISAGLPSLPASDIVARFDSTADMAGALAALMQVDMLEKPLCAR